jgi:hypothetical protein
MLATTRPAHLCRNSKGDVLLGSPKPLGTKHSTHSMVKLESSIKVRGAVNKYVEVQALIATTGTMVLGGGPVVLLLLLRAEPSLLRLF